MSVLTTHLSTISGGSAAGIRVRRDAGLLGLILGLVLGLLIIGGRGAPRI